MAKHDIPDSEIENAVSNIKSAADSRKCWSCGCLHSSLKAIEDAFPPGERPATLEAAIQAAKGLLAEVKYDCLGCEACYPAVAINALGVEGDACPAEDVKERKGWPPLPGSYRVLRYHAPVAICTLTDEKLLDGLSLKAPPELAIVGTLQTENIGIERLIINLLANPNIRFLLVCGKDSRQAIGHLPGQTLVSLARYGIDKDSRIVNARGKRPLLKNVSREAVEHFRQTVEVIDMVGSTDIDGILETARFCASRNPGPAEAFAPDRLVTVLKGHLPARMVTDPSGYFVLYVDDARRLLSLEHYQNDGGLDIVIEGKSAAELYIPAIEKGLISRLDHAAYLGRELSRAEHALKTGGHYVQDGAPESKPVKLKLSGCGCGPTCEEGKP